MKQLKILLEDKEAEALEKVKGKKTWKDLLLSTLGDKHESKRTK